MEIIDKLGIGHGNLILDVGAARGYNASAFLKAGYRLIALEIEYSLICDGNNIHETDQIPYLQADARLLPFKDNSFDGAIMIEVLEHIENPQLVIMELFRTVKSSSKVVIAVPSGYTETIYNYLHPKYKLNSGHVNIFTKNSITALLTDSGFKIDSIETKNLVPALSWIIHSLIRSEAKHTGEVTEHKWVDKAVGAPFYICKRIPYLKKLIRFCEKKFGKSYYIYCHPIKD